MHTKLIGLAFAVTALCGTLTFAQRGGGGQRGAGAAPAVPQTPRAAAPFDLTGYWISDTKGNTGGVPLNDAGRKTAASWDPAKEEAAGNSCKAYGAAGLLRLPTRLNITWENDTTLRIDTDAGTQIRRFHFGNSPAPADEPTWQGHSVAEWEIAAGAGRGQPRTGNLKVVTTRMRTGYLSRNGIPYGENAVLTEYFDRITTPDGGTWIVLTSEVRDSQYLTQPFITTTHFKKEADGSKWSPRPCSAR